MGQRTSIEWTQVTWNPTTGCTKVSEGCDNCYADTLARRLLDGIYRRRLPVVNTEANREDPFAVRIWPERLDQPAKWKGGRLVFVNSMSDLFHCDIPVEFQRAVFEVMLDVNRHTYQVLTKRPSRAASFVRRNGDLFGERGLRGRVDAGQYKDYILVMLFLKYISDLWDEHVETYRKRYGDDEARIRRRLDRERFVLLESARFWTLHERRNEPNIGELINIALEDIDRIEAELVDVRARMRGHLRELGVEV